MNLILMIFYWFLRWRLFHTKSNKISINISFYISSKNLSVKENNHAIRAYWSVGAMHYVRDASFVHTENAPTNFSIIRNITMNALKQKKYDYLLQAI